MRVDGTSTGIIEQQIAAKNELTQEETTGGAPFTASGESFRDAGMGFKRRNAIYCIYTVCCGRGSRFPTFPNEEISARAGEGGKKRETERERFAWGVLCGGGRGG